MGDIAADEKSFESPAWHADELRKTEADFAAGRIEVLNWDDGKKEFRSRSLANFFWRIVVGLELLSRCEQPTRPRFALRRDAGSAGRQTRRGGRDRPRSNPVSERR